jgi:hypothetical protein
MTLPTSRRSAGRRAIATAPLAPIRSFVALLGISQSIRLGRIVLVYLQSMITPLGAQLSVVLKEHSYPRPLT